jgi:hypothetical protein
MHQIPAGGNALVTNKDGIAARITAHEFFHLVLGTTAKRAMQLLIARAACTCYAARATSFFRCHNFSILSFATRPCAAAICAA